MSEPLFSIVTINRNNADGLRATMQSVLTQDFDDYEYIIIDGASTDGSVDVIREFLAVPEYAEKISYWVSEPDGGIYNAMNKGISQVVGKYCLLLNSGDWLIENGILTKVSKENLSEDIIYCDAYLVTQKTKKYVSYPDNVDASFFYAGNTLSHQNTFIKTHLQKRVLYTQNYKYAADVEFFMTAFFVENCTAKHLKYAISYFDAEFGISSIVKTAEERADEWKRLRAQFFSPRIEEAIKELVEFKYNYKGLLLIIRDLLRNVKKLLKRN